MKEVKKVKLSELEKMSEKMFGHLVKAVIDVEKERVVIDAEMHADQEKFMLDTGSEQGDLWGINIHPDKKGRDMIEFNSMINLRATQGNRSLSVEDPEIQEKIYKIMEKTIET